MRLYEGRDVFVDHETGTNVVVITCGPRCDLTLPSVEAVQAAIAPLAESRERLDILCDTTHIGKADLRLALRWVEFLRPYKGRVRLIIYRVPSAIAALVHIALATAPVAILVVPNERGARAAVARRLSVAIGPSPS